jgi:FkbM family methyltransferase
MSAGTRDILSRITRLYPFYRGRGRLALSSLLRTRGDEATKPILTSLFGGEAIYVFENDYISRMVQFFGDLDPAVSEVARKLVRPGDVVIDVGANLGILTLQTASIVGAAGHVFAFEPIKRLSALLLRSAAENKLHNITVFDVALSDVAGVGYMKVADPNLGCSALSPNDDGIPCEIKVLDEIEFGIHLKKPRLLKIDVEGHEANVLAGGRAFLDRYPPDYILFESHSTRGAFFDRPEVNILVECGYEFSAILNSTFGRPILREVISNDFSPATYNFLATLRV